MSSPSSSTVPSARRTRSGRWPAEQSVSWRRSRSRTLRLRVMNFSSIPAAQSRLFSSLAAAAGRVLGEDAVAGVARELGHHQGRRDPLARDVAQRDRQPVVGQRDEVVVVAADLVGRVVVGEELEAGDLGDRLRQEPLLHLLGELQVALQPLAFQERSRASTRSGSRWPPGWRRPPGRRGRPGGTACGRWCRAGGCPSAWPSGVSSGTHMTERIFRSAIEALVGRFLSLPASWLSTAFFWPRTWLTSDRLMLIGTSSSGTAAAERRPAAGPVLERLADQPLGLRVDAARGRAARPAGTAPSASRGSWGRRCRSCSSLERLRAISRIALSLTSGRTTLARALEREASRVCMFGSSTSSPSVTTMTLLVACGPVSLGGAV